MLFTNFRVFAFIYWCFQGNAPGANFIKKVKKGGFKSYMKTIGKLGGQNKIPRLSNDRQIAESLLNADLIN